jgi:hypothetical protein
MAKRKDTQADISAAPADAKLDAVTPKDAPLPVDAPKLAASGEAQKIIDVASLIGPVKPDTAQTDTAPPVADAKRSRLPAYAPLAASIALAAVIGALSGAAATSMFQKDTAAATASSAAETSALQATVVQLNGEIAALKSGLGTAQRSTTAQLGKLTERLDRAERAQAEPTAKLARLTESVDRLEKRQQQAAAAPAVPANVTASSDPDITGSINPYKEESRPPIAEGWRLRDFYSGRAVVEARNGMLFEVGPGSNLPGLGRVEAIKRENGRVVVVARNGVIVASSEQRRPPAPVPYRY